MSLKPLVIAKRLDEKKSEMTKLQEREAELKIREDAIKATIEEANTEEELDTVNEEVEDIEKLKLELEEEKKSLQEKINEIEEELQSLELEQDEDLEREAEKTAKGERKNMNNLEARNGLTEYVRSRGTTREGFTSVEGAALIPEEVLTAQEAPSEDLDLSKYANVVKVNSGSGKYPYIKKSKSKMISVTELATNPELAKPVITPINYDIETYRGHVPVSKEVIEDADYPVVDLIAKEVIDQERNTKNFEIASILKTAPAKEVVGLDGIKTQINAISRVYTTKLVMTSTLYNELDLLKDSNGRYIIQPDATKASGFSLSGCEVIVVDDTVLGAEGAKVAFIGDVKAFVTLFDRKQATIKWEDNSIYGELLGTAVRFDVVKTDEEAGVFATYTAAPIV